MFKSPCPKCKKKFLRPDSETKEKNSYITNLHCPHCRVKLKLSSKHLTHALIFIVVTTSWIFTLPTGVKSYFNAVIWLAWIAGLALYVTKYLPAPYEVCEDNEEIYKALNRSLSLTLGFQKRWRAFETH